VVKPQFESRPRDVPKGVCAIRAGAAVERVRGAAMALGLEVRGECESPARASGNQVVPVPRGPGVTRLGFAVNPTSESALALRERALGWCALHGVEAWAAEADARDLLVAELPTTDALVVLGGDGTFLRAVRSVAEVDVPILGINSGKVGFLSKAEAHQTDAVLAMLAEGAYELEPRMLVEARILRGGRPTDELPYIGLNEVAVVRGSQARVVRLEVMIDDSHLATYCRRPRGRLADRLDRLLLQRRRTLILDPTSRNLVVTPVAAYLAGIRSIVVSPNHVVTVRVEAAHDVLMSIDGREDTPLAVGDSVAVRARQQPVRFIEPRGAPPFWDLLRRKVELLPS
jgi:NAD+ kinase